MTDMEKLAARLVEAAWLEIHPDMPSRARPKVDRAVAAVLRDVAEHQDGWLSHVLAGIAEMGLDITAYSKLRHIGKHYDGDWCPDDDHIDAYAYSVFPRSFRGLPILETTPSPSDVGLAFFEAGCYEPTDGTDTHRFRAGSYGGYNRWRADLQQQFNPDRLEDGPFYELIWFADNEGSIGPEAAVDLLADFRQHQDRYVEPFEWGTRVYADWIRAFELAADGGLVHFH